MRFSASHQTLMADGSREPVHGHNYRVRVHLEARELDSAGMVADFARVKKATLAAVEPLDRRHMNDVLSHEPTAELIARHVYQRVARELDDPRVRVTRVEVWESENNRAEYRP